MHNVYVIEGEKTVHEYLQNEFLIDNIYATEEWITENRVLLQNAKMQVTAASAAELNRISTLSTPNQVVALAKIETHALPDKINTGLHLLLENIQDPGNLGTIIRTADWFGIENIFCSAGCVDAYNAKVVQATMGSLARVKLYYTDLHALLAAITLPVYAATLDGENIFTARVAKDAALIIGNESKGITQTLANAASKKISIPRYGKAESLNAAVATAVILAGIKCYSPR